MAAECCSSCERTSKRFDELLLSAATDNLRTVGYPSTSWASCCVCSMLIAIKFWAVQRDKVDPCFQLKLWLPYCPQCKSQKDKKVKVSGFI